MEFDPLQNAPEWIRKQFLDIRHENERFGALRNLFPRSALSAWNQQIDLGALNSAGNRSETHPDKNIVKIDSGFALFDEIPSC